MFRLLTSGVITVLVLSCVSGCTLVCGPYDDAYGAYGGAWQRGDQFFGRVGSDFQPAEIDASGTSESATPSDEPQAPLDGLMPPDGSSPESTSDPDADVANLPVPPGF